MDRADSQPLPLYECSRCRGPVAADMRYCPRCGYGGPDARSSRLAAAGYVLGLLLPVVGFVIALALFARNEIGPALAVLGCCLIGGVIGITLVL